MINYFEDRSCYIIYLSPVYSWRLETHRNSSTKKKGLEELPSEKTEGSLYIVQYEVATVQCLIGPQTMLTGEMEVILTVMVSLSYSLYRR